MEVCSLSTVSESSVLTARSIGLRPFGVSLLYAGYDPHYQFQLYHSDPSGNYSGWKATCIGANNGTAQSLLKQEYKDDITLEEAIGLTQSTIESSHAYNLMELSKKGMERVAKIKVILGHWRNRTTTAESHFLIAHPHLAKTAIVDD